MIIIGVFLIQQFQQYHLGEVRKNMNYTAATITRTLNDMDWQENKDDIQANISRFEMIMVGMEIYVIDKEDWTIISSPNTDTVYLGQNATNVLETDLIIGAFSGNKPERDVTRGKGESISRSKEMAYPLYDQHSRTIGAIYVRKNIDDIYDTLNNSKEILLNATLLALFITIILGFFIAKSITGPIEDVTIKAEKMSKGDFNQVVEVKSDDEIGQLAFMFNHLTGRLKEVLREMSSEKQKMDTIITYMADGLVAATEEGKIIRANPRAMEMLEISKGELDNLVFDEIFMPFNKSLTIKQLKSLENGESGSEMMAMSDGIILRANYASFLNEKNEFGGIIVLLQDVTKHEKLENMRKEFVANVSHELKTPLTTIKSYTETLADGVIENHDLSLQFLKVIDTEVDRMTRLVRDLLQLSNIDFQKGIWNKKSLDLNELAKKAVLKLEVFAKNKNQQIKYNLGEGITRLYGDEDRIEQVLLNILSNSIKYTPEGGAIEVYVEKTDSLATINIIDNGIGIPREDLPRLFERFYRVDKARSREMGGTGLGLSIAKEIIEAHEGKIQILSEEGQGTHVMITLLLLEE